jgi:farnesyl diphosphate synthase
MSFPEALTAASARVHARLDSALAGLPESRVRAAMTHALRGGKGLRGFLVLESAALHGVPETAALAAAAAIEAMHAYSLVHDDLPAMDDDALRRGLPTVHVAFDEATAILAGDALQSLAFELATDEAVPNAAALARGLARAAGAAGMVLGQALDIEAETAAVPLTLARIEALQAGKTGALFSFACTAGPVMAGQDAAPLAAFAAALGLAFQIADDLLDAEGDAALTGKAVGKDAAAGKATFVSHLGVAGARARAAELVDRACDALSPYGPEADTLRAAARFVIARDR